MTSVHLLDLRAVSLRKGIPSSSARQNSIMSCGRISGTPPTLVATTKSPADAASMMEIPKASVKELLKYIWPFVRTFSYTLASALWIGSTICLHHGHCLDLLAPAARLFLVAHIFPSSAPTLPSWVHLHRQ